MKILWLILLVVHPLGLTAQVLPAFRDVDYVGAGDPHQLLDVYLPEGVREPAPAVIFIHGGSWRTGSKGKALRLLEELQEQHGFVVADINYRLSVDSLFPAQIFDCKAAVRFLKANAGLFYIDTCRIGVVGTSAGGHLASLLGLSQGVEALEGRHLGNNRVSSAVHAVLSISGVGDLLDLDPYFPEHCLHPNLQDIEESATCKLLGCRPGICPDRALFASPISYVDEQEVPHALHHGLQDCTVPAQQSWELYDTLTALGNTAELFLYEGAGHTDLPGNLLQGRLNTFFLRYLGDKTFCPDFPTSEETREALNWTVFPNPFRRHFKLVSATPIEEPLIAQLFSAQGIFIKQFLIDRSPIRIQTGELSSGTYFLRIRGAQGITHLQVVKQ